VKSEFLSVSTQMKPSSFTIPSSATLLAVLFLFRASALAQGTVYLSNLGQGSAGGLGVGVGESLAQPFYTGNTSAGYTLNSIQLFMTAVSGPGPSGGFGLALYGDAGGLPGSLLATLSSPDNPSAQGVYTYTAAGISLLPLTPYWIEATSPPSSPYYWWSIATATSFSAEDGWGGKTTSPYSLILSGAATTGNGLGPLQFAVSATPVPEPGQLAWLVLGSATLFCHKAQRRRGRSPRNTASQ
jgi:hypothetical protein